MTTEMQATEALLEQIRLLSPEDRVRLMHGILETLIPPLSFEKTEILQFGAFRESDGPFSTLANYGIAEWRPYEPGLSGE